MKMSLVAAAAAATLWGGIALAQDDSASATVQSGDQQTQVQTDENGNVRSLSTSQTPQDTWRERSVPDQNTGVGGSGPAQVNPSNNAAASQDLNCRCAKTAQNGPTETSEQNLNCHCTPAQGTGGAGLQGTYNQGTTSGTYDQGAATGTYDQGAVQQNVPSDQYGRENEQSRRDLQEGTEGTGGSGSDTVVVKEGEENQGPDLNGVTVLLGGGAEGYTGALAPRVAVGPTYGATLQLRPTDILGLELEYSGAVHELKDNVTRGVDVASGADIVRNGARAMATVGLLDAPVQPYILGGVGVNWYSARGRAGAFGFKDDTSGEIPLGLGLRTQVAGFTADLRGLYNVPFNQDFAPGVGTTTNTVGGAKLDTQNDGRYQATLSVGANF